jgi:hypothetical protein
MIKESSEKRPENWISTHSGDGLSPEAVGEVAPEGRQACEALVDGRGEQPLFPQEIQS